LTISHPDGSAVVCSLIGNLSDVLFKSGSFEFIAGARQEIAASTQQLVDAASF